MNAPATVFEHGGKQYVLAYSAGNLFAGTARGDSLWLFGLDGTLEPAQPAGALLTFAPGAGGAAERGRGQDGLRHGVHVLPRRARRRRPRRRTDAAGDAQQRGSCCRRSAKAARTCRRSARTLTADQIRDVAAYVTQRLADAARLERALRASAFSMLLRATRSR